MAYLVGILALGFKVLMLIDAIKKGIERYWYFIIIFIPFGAWAYFFLIKLKDLNLHKAKNLFFDNTPSLSTLQHNLKMNPCAQNKIALARALQKSGKHTEAGQLFSDVLQLDPDSIEALYGLGSCYMENNKYAEATHQFEKILGINPAALDYEPWIKLAEISWLTDDREGSITRLRELVATAPRIRHQVIMAGYLVHAGQGTEARDILQDLIANYQYADAFIRRTNSRWIKQAKEILHSIRE